MSRILVSNPLERKKCRLGFSENWTLRIVFVPKTVEMGVVWEKMHNEELS
jgi:hypothetical protein